MNSEYTEQLTALLDGRLNAAEAAELRAQMLRDPDLADLYEQLRAQSQCLQTLPRWKVPPGFAHRLMQSIAELDLNPTASPQLSSRDESTYRARTGFGWKRWVALAASISGVALLLTYFVSEQAGWNEMAKRDIVAPAETASKGSSSPTAKAGKAMMPKAATPEAAKTFEGKEADDQTDKLVRDQEQAASGQLGAPPQRPAGTSNTGASKSLKKEELAKSNDAQSEAPMPSIVANIPQEKLADPQPTPLESKDSRMARDSNGSVAGSDPQLVPNRTSDSDSINEMAGTLKEPLKGENEEFSGGFGGGGGGRSSTGAMPGQLEQSAPTSGNPDNSSPLGEEVAGDTRREHQKSADLSSNFLAEGEEPELWVVDLPHEASSPLAAELQGAAPIAEKKIQPQLDCFLVTLPSGETPRELSWLQQAANVQKLSFGKEDSKSRLSDWLKESISEDSAKYKQIDEMTKNQAVPLTGAFDDDSSSKPEVHRLGLASSDLDRAFGLISNSQREDGIAKTIQPGSGRQLPTPSSAASRNGDVQAGLEYLRRLSTEHENLADRFDSNKAIPSDEIDRKTLEQKKRDLPFAGSGGLDGGNADKDSADKNSADQNLAGQDLAGQDLAAKDSTGEQVGKPQSFEKNARRILIFFRHAEYPLAPPKPAPTDK